MLFAPINVAAFRYTPQHLRGAAVGLFALLRNEGGSVGMSIGKIIEQRREQFHLARVGENLSPLNPKVQSFFNQGQAYYIQRTGDPARSQQMTLRSLADLREQQAASLAYFDVFWLFAVLSLGLVLLVLLMKRSVAEKGELIGGE
jgi:DHA2 family multidrug resistance protein